MVKPSYEKLWMGEDVLGSMRLLADGYREMGQYEFALCAYKYLLFRTYSSGFDQEIRNHISTCLSGLGMEAETSS
jgi:hypothetical protein